MNGYYKLSLILITFFYYSSVEAQTDTLTYIVNGKYKYYVCSNNEPRSFTRTENCIKGDSADYRLPYYMTFFNLHSEFGKTIITGIGQRFRNVVFVKPQYNIFHQIKNKSYLFYQLMFIVRLVKTSKYKPNKFYRLYEYLFHEDTTWGDGQKMDVHYKITFCPQIGILKYDIWGDDRGEKIKATIELSTINGKPLADFMKENKCITPFCDF